MCKALLLACALGAASAALSHTPVVVGQTSMAGGQDPTVGSTPWSLTSHGIAEKLFTVDKTGNIVGQVGTAVTKVDKLTWKVTLSSGYKFSDGTLVTPEHVIESLTTQNTKNSNGNDALGAMTVTKVDGVTVQIKSAMAHPAMDAALANWVFVIFMKKGENYIYTGPYKVETFGAAEIKLVPNPHYPDAAGRPLLTIKKFANGDALADALSKKELDLAFHLPIDKLKALRSVDGVTVKSFEVGYHYMMFQNMRDTSPLKDLKVRQAVDRVLDRTALQQALAGGKATRSLFPEATPFYSEYMSGTLNLHADKAAAAKLLDEAGWSLHSSGKRMKGGAELALSLIAYPFRPGLGIMQPVIKASLEGLGITVNDQNVDIFSAPGDAILKGKTYDLLMWAQHTLPNGDPQWFLNAFFRGDPMDGRNYAGLNSSAVDKLLDDMALAGHANGARAAAAKAAHDAIMDEAAVSNLVTPEWHVGVSGRLSEYDPWGADYYVIRKDFHETKSPTPAPPATSAATTTKAPMEASAAQRPLLGLLCLAPLLFVA